MYNIVFLLLTFLIVYEHTIANPLEGYVKNAKPNEIPFIVSISHKNLDEDVNAEENHYCGGSLITKKLVLTAEHCVNEETSDDILVIVGSIDLRAGKKYEVDSMITFDNWAKQNDKSNDFDMNDIAIIKLKECISEDLTLGLLSNIKMKDLYKIKAKTAGWGETEDGKFTRFLLTANLVVIDHDECNKMIRKYLADDATVPDEFFCTNNKPFQILGCGDSGGPLVKDENEIIGVNIRVCPTNIRCKTDVQNIHISVEHYSNFINSIMDENNC